MHASIAEKRDDLVALCRRLGVSRLEVFGSAARGVDFDPARSDADFLVDFTADSERDHNVFFEMKDALARILGRPVDLIERKAIERSRNYIRRRHILGDAQAVYVA